MFVVDNYGELDRKNFLFSSSSLVDGLSLVIL